MAGIKSEDWVMTVDWSKAPEEATHFVMSNERRIPGGWYRADGNKMRHTVNEGEYTFRLDDLHPQRMIHLIERPWNGEGLPPVGAVCEFLVLHDGDSSWVEGQILYCSPYTVVISSEVGEHVHHPRNLKFRPIRNPEQIAAEERKEAIDKLVQFFMNYYGNPKGAEQYLLICRSLHDAGYRKQEQP